jgi:hypothetical protein
MKKLIKPESENPEQLTKFLRVRLAPADAQLLDDVIAAHAFANRGMVAREALRIGLEILMERVTKKKD